MRFFNLLKMLPPVMRFFSHRFILAFSWSPERTFIGFPMRMRKDVPKIVPPFILQRWRCVHRQGSNKREEVCIKG